MELHHKKHHQTYVNSFNDASDKLAAAVDAADIQIQLALQPLLNFHGGGHVNHSLFWENLAPKGRGGGGEPGGKLRTAVDRSFGDFAGLKKEFSAKLAGIQGSGWAWLIRDNVTGAVSVKTYAVRGLQQLEGREVWADVGVESGSCGWPVYALVGD
jgi:Fe-Mn family superoxide dismutase